MRGYLKTITVYTREEAAKDARLQTGAPVDEIVTLPENTFYWMDAVTGERWLKNLQEVAPLA